MAEFKNNAFTIDTNDEHGHRVDICVEGMATYDAASYAISKSSCR